MVTDDAVKAMWFKRYVLTFVIFLIVSLALLSVNLTVPPNTILDQSIGANEQSDMFNVSRGTISLYMYTEDGVEREVEFTIVELERNETVSDGVYKAVPDTMDGKMGRLLVIRDLSEGEYSITVLQRDAPVPYRLLIAEYLIPPSMVDFYFWGGMVYLVVSGVSAGLYFRDPKPDRKGILDLLEPERFNWLMKRWDQVTKALLVILMTIGTLGLTSLLLISIII